MKKPELLSPCGDMECLKAAVYNGCDAVYLGGESFGARKFAKNFSRDEIVEAVKFCHLYGVRVFVTVNTVVYEDEVEQLIDYVRFLHKSNVDALIVQDLGVMNIIRHKFPNMEIHASTQAHNYDNYGIEAVKNIGCKRVVLARELTLDEVKNIKVDIEKEVFVHGALCLCYSGNCLFSAFANNRSGNRGECVGSCRMKYKFLQNNKELDIKGEYPLSMKSLCTLPLIGKLIDAGIDSFKIEGRMKSKEYVGYITRLYREKIDEYLTNKTVTVTKEEVENMMKLYNREFTLGYLFNDINSDHMNNKSSNHMGVVIGDMLYSDKKIIKFRLRSDLYQEDGIRFDNKDGMIVNKLYNEKMLLVNHLSKGDIAIVDNKIGLDHALIVRKTIDSKLNEAINNFEKKKVEVSIKCDALVGKELSVTVVCGDTKITKTGAKLEKADKAPTSKERIIEQLSKLGGTPFKLDDIKVNTKEDAFVPIKLLNDLRRECISELTIVRENSIPHKFSECDYEVEKNNKKNKFNINILVSNEEQLNEVAKYKVNNIYTSDFELYKKYKKNYNMFYRTDRVEKDFKELKKENILATNLSAVYKYYKNNTVISDSYLNVLNSSAIEYLNTYKLDRITLSYENTLDNLKELKDYLSNIEVIVYGTPELMVMKHDLIDYNVHTNDKFKEFYKYSIEGINKDRYKIIKENDNTYIYDKNKYNLLDKIDYIKSLKVGSIRLEFFDEDKNTINGILKEVFNG